MERRRSRRSLRAGQNLLVAAHGNSIRAIVKMLDNVPESEIVELNIPTGVPLLYEFDAALKPTGHRYLGDPAAITAAAEAVRTPDRKALSCFFQRPYGPVVVGGAVLGSELRETQPDCLHLGHGEPHPALGMHAVVAALGILLHVHRVAIIASAPRPAARGARWRAP